MTSRIEKAISGDGTAVVAYMAGHRFVRYTPMGREALAVVFEEHGFVASAKILRDIEPIGALQRAVSRHGTPFCARSGRKASNGVEVAFSLDRLVTESTDVRSWGVYRAERTKGERGSRPMIGARVFAGPNGVEAAAPVDSDGPAHAECTALAESLAVEARDLLTCADASDLSTALVRAYQDAGSYSFIARGLYIAEASNPATSRLVALLAEIRKVTGYDKDRAGVAARAVAVSERDTEALSDAVISDAERRVAALLGALREYSAPGRKAAPKQSALAHRRDEAAELLTELDTHASLLGSWAERLKADCEAIRSSFNAALEHGDPLVVPDCATTDPDAEEAQEPPPASAPIHAAPVPEPAPAPSAAEEEDPFGPLPVD